jgi:glycosyltransferase involved in cell wall biosynthesis
MNKDKTDEKLLLVVEIAISTLEEGIHKVKKILLEERAGLKYLIVHQCSDSSIYDYESIFSGRPDVRVIVTNTIGLAISRNIAADNVSGDIIIPTDDDIVLLASAIDQIIKIHLNYKSEIITFTAVDENGEPRRLYPSKIIQHNKRSVFSLSSIEITIKRSAFENGLRWDTDFGLGQKYRGGLENAMMYNALFLNIGALFYPSVIVKHPKEGTGQYFDEASALMRGALIRKGFSSSYIILIFLFVIKNYSKIPKQIGIITYTLLMFKSAFSYSGSH